MHASEVAQLPVFVINLDADAARRAEMEQTLGTLGIAWQRIAGVDGSKLSPEARAELNRRARLRQLTPGEIGCLESHVRIWRLIAAGKHAAAVVLEDDVLLAPAVVSLVQDAGWLPSDDCIVRLEASPMRVVLGPREASVDGHGLYRLRSFQYGSGAYVVTQTRARALLAAYLMRVDSADGFMFRFPKDNHVYQLLPGVCMQKVWQADHAAARTGLTVTQLEAQRLAADRRSWFDPPAALRRLRWKIVAVGAIAWDVIRGYHYRVPDYWDNGNDV
ncbi:MAG: glycosyltransferase family 25 protein [Pseudomonadota bacterium]